MTDPTPSVPDSAGQIAVRIADAIWELGGGVDIREDGVRLITEALTAFGRAQYERGRIDAALAMMPETAKIIEETGLAIFREAIEKAAEVAFTSCEAVQGQRICVCAKRIRQLLPKEGAKG